MTTVNFNFYLVPLMAIDIDRFRLKSLSFFGMLSPDDRAYAREQITIRELKKGQVLFREGTFSKGVYIVRKGRVKISHTTDDGKESIIYIYKRAEFFGYRPLLAGEPQPVTASALDSAEVYFLPASVFSDLLERSETLPKQLLVNLSREFSVWINKLTVFSQYAVRERVALALLLLCKVYGTEDKPRPTITIGRDDFASYVGTAKETVVRMLRVYKDAKIITSKGARITVLKPDALRDFLSHL